MAIQTFYELVRQSTERHADRIAYTMLDGEDVTYREAADRMNRIQEMLLSAGLHAGDKVALFSSSMPNWGVSYFAVVSAGMVIVPILPGFSGEEVDKILEHAEAKALLVSDKLYGTLLKETIDRLNIVIRTKNRKVLTQRVEEPGSKAIPQPDDVAALIYTSGTTSSPKGVMLSHRALVAHLDLCRGFFPIHAEDRFLSVLPLSHVYECSIGLIYPFAEGARVFYLDRPPAASALVPAMRRVRPTIMLIVPLVIDKIYRSQVLAKFTSNKVMRSLYALSPVRRLLHRIAGRKLFGVFGGCLRFLGIGGAKLDTMTERFLLESGMPYAIGYGLTETAPLLAGAVPDNVALGTTGPAAPGVELRLVNINPETHQGELVARTPCLMKGYYKNPEATAEVIDADGWFHTGDLGELDANGRLSIKGRLKNMILGPGGENIYPEDIESVLNTHVCIEEALVTEQEGHRLVAFVHFNHEQLERSIADWRSTWKTHQEAIEAKSEQLCAEIKEYVNEKVNRFSHLSEVIELKEDFIKTPSMKIRRFLYNNLKNLNKIRNGEDSVNC